jgi:hypothetical protein
VAERLALAAAVLALRPAVDAMRVTPPAVVDELVVSALAAVGLALAAALGSSAA